MSPRVKGLPPSAPRGSRGDGGQMGATAVTSYHCADKKGLTSLADFEYTHDSSGNMLTVISAGQGRYFAKLDSCWLCALPVTKRCLPQRVSAPCSEVDPMGSAPRVLICRHEKGSWPARKNSRSRARFCAAAKHPACTFIESKRPRTAAVLWPMELPAAARKADGSGAIGPVHSL